MLDTLSDRKVNFINYLNGIDIDERWKAQLTDEKTLGIATQVYLFYPEFFWTMFKERDSFEDKEDVLDKLCIAGYLYFLSLLIQDKIIDTGHISSYESILRISWLQEECLKILCSIFPPDSSFWKLWNQRRNAYFSSAHVQKEQSVLSFSEYKELADNKSAFGKVAIDCCYTLFKNDENEVVYKKLINSHTFFSIGAQLMDDLKDLDEDFKLNQINYAIQTARESIKEIDGTIDINDLGVIKKYLYTSGLYVQLLDLADEYYIKGIKEIMDLKDSKRWYGCFLHERKNIFKQKTIFTIFTKELYVKTHYSHEINPVPLSETEALKQALAFMFKQQDSQGSWTDMITNAGFSNIWTTGFVLSNISFASEYQEEKAKAVEYLKRKKTSNSLWGYSEKWEVADADSSTNVLMGLLLNDALNDADVECWITWFIEDEGFSTYNDIKILEKALPEFKDFSGWTQAHHCVSALAFNLLSIMPGSLADKYYQNLKYLLFNQQNEEGLWDAYWWTSSIYSSCYIIKALILKEGDSSFEEAKKIIDNILRKANPDKSFGTPFDSKSVFYTALVLDTLCTSQKIYDLYKEEAEAISRWIINHQYRDGSFAPSYILRIPAPHILDPGKIEEWSTSDKVPVNVVKSDVMRLYTTSVVCKALNGMIHRKQS